MVAISEGVVAPASCDRLGTRRGASVLARRRALARSRRADQELLHARGRGLGTVRREPAEALRGGRSRRRRGPLHRPVQIHRSADRGSGMSHLAAARRQGCPFPAVRRYRTVAYRHGRGYGPLTGGRLSTRGSAGQLANLSSRGYIGILHPARRRWLTARPALSNAFVASASG